MSKDRWQHISTFHGYDSAGVRDILVWNDCNGPYLVKYASDDWFRILHKDGDCWNLWRPVVGPTEIEIATAARVAERYRNRPAI